MFYRSFIDGKMCRLGYRNGLTNTHKHSIVSISSLSHVMESFINRRKSKHTHSTNHNISLASINVIRRKFSSTESSSTTYSSKTLLEECSKLHGSIMPLNERIRGPLARYSERQTHLPFVLLVGNHSSGKSTFINHIWGRNIQTAGVAPTDDCFTILSPGTQDWDRDGPSLISDPDFGFGALRQFGPTLIHHTQLKIRSSPNIHDFMMVDSPGMIDSPVSREGMMMYNYPNHPFSAMTGGSNISSPSILSSSSNIRSMDRGYDFAGVVRWLADRADVVLLFFDPDKPGTTGETLNILLHSLGGMDHKLLIVLNKADQFKKVSGTTNFWMFRLTKIPFVYHTDFPPFLNQIHDFARAYGSLCWNLSKVIPRKDLPRIFTMCIPVSNNTISSTTATISSTTQTSANPSSTMDMGERSLGLGLADLHQTREEVIAEVMKAPQRRVDNVITQLHDSLHLLLMHALVAEDIRSKYSRYEWENKLQEMGSLLTGVGISAMSMYWNIPYEFTGGIVVATLTGVGILHFFNRRRSIEMEHQLVTPEEMSASFQRTHSREIRDADEFTASVWQRIREPLRLSLTSMGLRQFPVVSTNDIKHLKRMLDEDIPRLRRTASPSSKR